MNIQQLIPDIRARIQREGCSPRLAAELHEAGVRFIPIVYLYAIGHLAMELDCCFKEERLGYRPSYTMILLAPSNEVVNLHLLEYWKKYAQIVTAPEDCLLLKPLAQMKELRYEIDSYVMRDGETAKAYAIYKEWGDQPPLIRVTEEDRRRGREWLSQQGVPADAWFVCMHARESGGRPQDTGHTQRNVDISTYFPAMEEIVKRGGWCVRMGDAAMQPLPAMPHVIDYACGPQRADWLDVFLFGSCRFMLGCSSGPTSLTASFGVPTISTNIVPLSVGGLAPQDLAIYKRLWSKAKNQLIGFEEILAGRLGQGNCFAPEYERLGVTVLDNTPDEIKATVIEMIERLEGVAQYTTEDERLQARFKGLLKPGHYGYGSAARVGRDFLRASADLLGGAGKGAAKKIVIETTKAVAFDSPDHIQPWGTARDDSTNFVFNAKLQWWLPPESIRVMDIGCSGGGFVKSILDQGGFAVGIEGSDYSKKMRRAQWATIPDNLFTSDATAVFKLFELDDDGTKSPLKVSVVTAWEFIEHIKEADLPNVMSNIDRHLSPNGVIIMSVSPNEEKINGVTLHLCVHDRNWWLKKFDELGYQHHQRAIEFFGNDLVRWEANAPGSFHVVLTRKGERLPFPARLSIMGPGYARAAGPLVLTAGIVAKDRLRDQVIRVIEIGTGGEFDSCWDAYDKHVELIGFHPDAGECERRNGLPPKFGRREHRFPLALAGAKGERVLYPASGGGVGSFLQPNWPFADRFNQTSEEQKGGGVAVATMDLDSFISETKTPYVDFIRVDAGGAELEILQGAASLLKSHVFGVSVNVFLQPYRVGQPTFPEIHALLEAQGFRLFDLQPERWQRGLVSGSNGKKSDVRGQVARAQIVYLKDYVGMRQEKEFDLRTLDKARVLRMVTIAEVLGFGDFAVELMEAAATPPPQK